MPNDIRTRPQPVRPTSTPREENTSVNQTIQRVAAEAQPYVPSGTEKVGGFRAAVALVGASAGKVVKFADLGGTAADAGRKVLEHPRYGAVASKVIGRINAGKIADGFERFTGHAEKVGIVAAAASAAINSKTHHAVWKVGEGVAVGAATKVFLSGVGELAVAGVKVGNPLVLADMGLNYFGEKLIGAKNHERAGGYISGHVVTIPARLAMAYAEAIVHGDMRALDEFSEEAKAGKLGVVYQAAINAGEKLNEWTGSLLDRASALLTGARR